jgi:hypothetical protein
MLSFMTGVQYCTRQETRTTTSLGGQRGRPGARELQGFHDTQDARRSPSRAGKTRRVSPARRARTIASKRGRFEFQNPFRGQVGDGMTVFVDLGARRTARTILPGAGGGSVCAAPATGARSTARSAGSRLAGRSFGGTERAMRPRSGHGWSVSHGTREPGPRRWCRMRRILV